MSPGLFLQFSSDYVNNYARLFVRPSDEKVTFFVRGKKDHGP